MKILAFFKVWLTSFLFLVLITQRDFQADVPLYETNIGVRIVAISLFVTTLFFVYDLIFGE